MNNSKVKLLILCVSVLSMLCAAGFLLSCSDNPVDSITRDNQLAMNLSIASSPELMEMVNNFVVHVSGDGFETFSQSLDIEDGYVRGTINSVPAGDAITFTVQALDGSLLIYEGTDTIPVQPDTVNNVNVVLIPVVSMVKLSPRYLEVGTNQESSFELKVYGIRNLSQLSFRLHWDFPALIRFSTEVSGILSNRVLVFDTLGGAVAPPYYYACAFLNTEQANRIVDANGNATLGTVSFTSPTPEILPVTMVITMDSLAMYDTAGDPIVVDTIYGDQATVVVDSAMP
ncbi:MAG: hypothetical protein KOO62_05545 [candidate division Zixibacteria bacterium]|nr:hypothetical protein [candidate division Zixibacteria bacterium]